MLQAIKGYNKILDQVIDSVDTEENIGNALYTMVTNQFYFLMIPMELENQMDAAGILYNGV